MLDPEMFPDHVLFMLSLMDGGSKCIPIIICIAQIICEFIYYTLLVYEGRLFFRDSAIFLLVNTGCNC